MDVLLTPVVNRLLRRFIKQAAGKEVSQLRVSLSRGSVALHHLELNLDELTAQLPVTVKRAYARQLTLSVPWASFTSQPLQVTLDTVEVVLALNDNVEKQDSASTAEGGRESARLGSLTTLLLRTLLDTGVVLNNVVVKYIAHTTVATLTCQSVSVSSPANANEWKLDYEQPQDWLKKVLKVQNVTISLSDQKQPGVAPSSLAPLLRTQSFQVAATMPVFAILDPQRRAVAAARYQASIAISVDWLHASVTDQQLVWLRVFAASIAALQRQQKGVHARAEATGPASHVQPEASSPPGPKREARAAAPGTSARAGRLGSGGMAWVSRAAMAAISDAWDYVIDEAAVAEAAPQLAVARPDIDVAVTAALAGAKIMCSFAEDMKQHAAATAATEASAWQGLSATATVRDFSLQQLDVRLQALSLGKRGLSSPKFMLEQGSGVHQDEWTPDEVLGLHPLGDGTETISVDGDSTDHTALHIDWQVQQLEGVQSMRHLMLQSGQLAYTHTPGLAADISRFIGLSNATQPAVPSARQPDCNAAWLAQG
ncbi:hypothetical protein WJX73_003685 [Symbiochloris irregularis]|uniref:Chorein N-terminal domain-containing protein n=1 Tax=Symbiochloris irregularis TaxID=706552 RepID=A0AAW1PL52_9CHLO